MKQKLYYQYAGSCFLLLFMFLGYVVKFYPDWLTPFDNFTTTMIRSVFPTLNSYFLWITKFANPLSLALICVALVIILLRGKYYAEALWLSLGTGIIAGVVNPLIKLLFLRERPSLEHLVTENSFSFPSGHSTGSMIFYGTLIFLVPLFLTNKKAQRTVQGLLIFLIVMIGISRIYLGVHFPTDVLGGFCIGLCWLCFSYPYYEKQRFVWRFKNKQL